MPKKQVSVQTDITISMSDDEVRNLIRQDLINSPTLYGLTRKQVKDADIQIIPDCGCDVLREVVITLRVRS